MLDVVVPMEVSDLQRLDLWAEYVGMTRDQFIIASIKRNIAVWQKVLEPKLYPDGPVYSFE